MSKETGGPAFPATEEHGLNSGTFGITARDYFATHAPEAPVWFKDGHAYRASAAERLAIQAEWRYAYADAMLAERLK